MSKTDKCPKCGAELNYDYPFLSSDGQRGIWRWVCESAGRMNDGENRHFDQSPECKDNQITCLATRNKKLEGILDRMSKTVRNVYSEGFSAGHGTKGEGDPSPSDKEWEISTSFDLAQEWVAEQDGD